MKNIHSDIDAGGIYNKSELYCINWHSNDELHLFPIHFLYTLIVKVLSKKYCLPSRA